MPQPLIFHECCYVPTVYKIQGACDVYDVLMHSHVFVNINLVLNETLE